MNILNIEKTKKLLNHYNNGDRIVVFKSQNIYSLKFL